MAWPNQPFISEADVVGLIHFIVFHDMLTIVLGYKLLERCRPMLDIISVECLNSAYLLLNKARNYANEKLDLQSIVGLIITVTEFPLSSEVNHRWTLPTFPWLCYLCRTEFNIDFVCTYTFGTKLYNSLARRPVCNKDRHGAWERYTCMASGHSLSSRWLW